MWSTYGLAWRLDRHGGGLDVSLCSNLCATSMDPQTQKTANQQANTPLTVTATPATGTLATGTPARGTSATGVPSSIWQSLLDPCPVKQLNLVKLIIVDNSWT